jgi:hypothetical protein
VRRGPTEQEQAELLRRHAVGDTTPLRTSADPSWTSVIGMPAPGIDHPLKGVSHGIPMPPPEVMHDPRGALASAIAERNRLTTQRQDLLATVAKCSVEVSDAQQRLDGLGEADRRAWAQWADGPTEKPRPIPSAPLHSEFLALLDAAKRKHLAAHEALDAFAQSFADTLGQINAQIKRCQESIVLEEANRLRTEMAHLMIETEKRNAAIQRLAQWLAKNGHQQAFTAVRQPLHSNEQRKSMRARLDASIQSAEKYPDALLGAPTSRIL